jgi:hypothetical protein
MPTVGTFLPLSGDVTTLNWIGPRPPRMVEINLGFGYGRLAAGYWIAVLKEPLQPDDFVFGGTTMRSGGRLGLPASNAADDALRPRVHDQIMNERGAQGYRGLQHKALATVPIVGWNRIAKVLPVTAHNAALAPDLQYPTGGGGLQWTIDRAHKKRFLIALHVDPAGMADAGSFTVSLADNQPFHQLYDARAKVARHLATA